MSVHLFILSLQFETPDAEFKEMEMEMEINSKYLLQAKERSTELEDEVDPVDRNLSDIGRLGRHTEQKRCTF